MTVAVDTNIVVRLIVADDEDQLARISDLITRHDLLIPLTVLLETQWVLRSSYGYSHQAVANAFSGLASLEHISLEGGAMTTWAISRYTNRADLADMLHLVACDEGMAFATFDRKLATAAGRDAPSQVMTLR